MIVVAQLTYPTSPPIALGGTTDAALVTASRGQISARVLAGSVVIQCLRWLPGIGAWERLEDAGQPVSITPNARTCVGTLDNSQAPAAIAAVWDTRGACAGWRLFRLYGCRTYTNFLIQWAKHPSQPGDWCDKANDLPTDNGYFERTPLPDRPLSGGGGREFCFFEEFTPNG